MRTERTEHSTHTAGRKDLSRKENRDEWASTLLDIEELRELAGEISSPDDGETGQTTLVVQGEKKIQSETLSSSSNFERLKSTDPLKEDSKSSTRELWQGNLLTGEHFSRSMCVPKQFSKERNGIVIVANLSLRLRHEFVKYYIRSKKWLIHSRNWTARLDVFCLTTRL